MSDYINTRDLMLGETEDERAWQALNKLWNDELTDLTEDGVRYIRSGAIKSKNNLVSINLPELTRLHQYYCIIDLPQLETLKIDKVRTLSGARTLVRLPKLKHLKLYNINNFNAYDFFRESIGPRILEIDCGDNPLTITNYFGETTIGSSRIRYLILRNTSRVMLTDDVLKMSSPFYCNDGKIFVPSDLVEEYKEDTWWSKYADYIYPIQLDENNEVIIPNETITDSWAQIFQSEANGTYSTKYQIGDTKMVQIDGKDVLMQIAAFDTDVLEDNSTAKITWVTRYIYDTQRYVTYRTSNWKFSFIYTYLNDVDDGIYSKIESTVKNAIIPVKKPYLEWTNNGIQEDSSIEKLWLLSAQEVNKDSGTKETTGVQYSLFNTINNRVRVQEDTYSAVTWILRSTSNYSYIYNVNSNGQYDSKSQSLSYGIIFGFCT